jgi:hypothetical protein
MGTRAKKGPDAHHARPRALRVNGSQKRRPAAVTVAVVDTVGAGFACLVPGDWEGFPRRSELMLLDAKEPLSR